MLKMNPKCSETSKSIMAEVCFKKEKKKKRLMPNILMMLLLIILVWGS